MENKKYYWLKLKRDFFKRHDIQIIESMPNGKDYILFYLKLLCESVDHEGNLRFSEEIPYNEEMLSVITNTNIDVVRSAINVFTKLNMMELLDDGTFYMNEVNKMIGSAVDNDNANRQRRFRERKKELALQECYDSVTNNNESKSIDIELDKEKDIDKENIIINNNIKEIQEIFDFWNDQDIIKHNKLTDDMKKVIKKLLDEFDVEQIKECISHYAEAYHSEYEYCKYKWNLLTFFKQKNAWLEFLDDGSKWNNYLRWKQEQYSFTNTDINCGFEVL